MTIQELGHVVLFVKDLKRSADFYKDTLGFKEISRGSGMALFSAGRTHHELLLIETAVEKRTHQRGEPGLYHIGFKIGDGPEALVNAHKDLRAKHVRIVGATDHTVTHSLYILDPDGNELELYADITENWKTNPSLILNPPKPLSLPNL